MDASRFIFTLDNALTETDCTSRIQSFNVVPAFNQHTKDGKWKEQEAGWKVPEYDLARFINYYNEHVGLTLPVPATKNTETFRIKRYRPGTGEEFRTHHDAKGYYCNRYLVLLWYLNDVAEGGETVFPDLGVSIKPKAGRLLMFPPHWMFQHAGLPPISGDKYILSTYLLY